MNEEVQAVLDRLEYYEAVHPDPVPIRHIPFTAADRELLHRKLRDYEDARKLVRNTKIHGKKTKELESIRARTRDEIALLLFKHDSLLGIELDDGRILKVVRGRAAKATVVLKFAPIPKQKLS
jgi:hypothetical protein